jgi:hypothetical protein
MKENKNIEVEINFKNIPKNPVRLFGLVYPYFIVVFVTIGLVYIHYINVITTNEISPVLPDTTEYQKDIQPVKGSVTAGIDLSLLTKPSDKFIQKGKELYTANCSACHGEKGDGNGPAGASLNPKPRDYYSPEGWKNGRSFSMIFKTLQEGIPKSAMTAYDFIPITDRITIIQYIRALVPDLPALTQDEVKKLDETYHLSQGEKTSTQIPISLAESKLEDESKFSDERIESILNRLNNDKSESGAILFNSLTYDKKKALITLSKSKEWKNDISEFLTLLNYNKDSGFKPDVLLLSKEDLSVLFNYLKNLFSVKNT